MSEKHCIVFKADSDESLETQIEMWLNCESSDMEITHCKYQLVREGAWNSPVGESIVFSALIIYEYPHGSKPQTLKNGKNKNSNRTP